MTMARMNHAIRLTLAAAIMGFAALRPAWADTDARGVPPFHAVSLSGAWSVDVTVGKPQSVVIEGDEKTIARVKTEVVDGELRVSLVHSLFDFGHAGRLSAHIAVPSLDGFSRSGSGDAVLTGLDGANLSLVSNGSGTTKAEGHAGNVALTENGSSTADLASLKSDEAVVTINGSGDAVVQADRALIATINGSGRIEYVGEPRVTSAIHGSGSVEKR